MEKKILRIKPMGEILKSLSTTSDDIFLVAVSREMANITEFADGVDLIEVGSLKREISQELDKAREEGREELLDSIVVGIKQLKSIVEMFNPMSIEIRAKQSGEIEAYKGLLEKLSKLKDNK